MKTKLLKKKIFAIVMSFTIALMITPVSAANVNEVRIKNLDELFAFLTDVNGGNDYAGKTVLLEDNIDVSGVPTVFWPSIGNTVSKPFRGTFDGQGKTISGIWMYESTEYPNGSGFFGTIENAVIKNLNISTTTGTDLGINTRTSAGAVVGFIKDSASNQTSVIENIQVRVQIEGNRQSIGAVIGKIELKNTNSNVIVKNCTASGTILSSEGGLAGGVIGEVVCLPSSSGSVTIQNCTSGVFVTAFGDYAGGFVSKMDNQSNNMTTLVENCKLSTGAYVNNTGRYTGGFAGVISGFTVKNSTASNYAVFGRNSYVGGFAGSIKNSELTSCVTSDEPHYSPTPAKSNSGYVGGFAGEVVSSILTDCHAGGGAKGAGAYVGGFAGIIQQSTITDCYERSIATSTGNYIGGFAGVVKSSEITNSFALGGATSTGGNYVGGFAGSIEGSTFYNCLVTGYVKGKGTAIGAFAGRAAMGSVSGCFYDQTVAYEMASIGTGANLLSGSVSGSTTREILFDKIQLKFLVGGPAHGVSGASH